MIETEKIKNTENTKTQNTEQKAKPVENKEFASNYRTNHRNQGKPYSGNYEGGASFKKRFVFKKRECYLTKNKISHVDYKDVELLKRFVGKNGRILPRRFTGTSALFQRKIANAIKKARAIALLPYVGNIEYTRKKPDRFNTNTVYEKKVVKTSHIAGEAKSNGVKKTEEVTNKEALSKD